MFDGFHILTVTHRRTPLREIGKFLIASSEETEVKDQLCRLRRAFDLEELMYLTTCNRVMFLLYCESPLPDLFPQQFFRFCHPAFSEDYLREHVLHFRGEAAVEHLFQVASSTDSLVVGEREILRQLRQAYERCRQWNLTGDNLRLAVQHAVLAAKDVYANTRIGERPVSVVSLAIQKLLKTELPKNARILMVGAGQTNLLVAKFLAKHGFSNVIVFNRTAEKAEQLAFLLGGKACGLEALEHYTGGFDCLIACTGAVAPLIDKPLYARLLNGDIRRKILLDLAVPNNIAKEVARSFNVHFTEMEDLRTQAQENISFREEEIAAAAERIKSHVADFETVYRQRRIERALQRIPAAIKEVRERAMNEVFKQEIESLESPARLLLERMMAYMEEKCTGIPIKLAKKALTKAI